MSLKYWVFAVFCLWVPAAFAESAAAARQIIVIGEGSASAVPDRAVMTLGARHSAKSAAEAMAQTSAAVTAILARMQDMGIEAKDIQTAQLSLNPVWDRSKRYEDGEQPEPIGFEAANTVQVILRDLDRLGAVLDEVLEQGANSFSGFRFGLSDPQPVLDAARNDAVKEARRKAELYAQAAGVALGDILLITEELGGGGFEPPVMMEMAAARSAPVPVAQGEVSQTARVKIVFAIK